MFRREITAEAAMENLGTVLAFVEDCLEQLGAPPRVQVQITMAVDELFVNIASYAYPDRTGTATVRVEADEPPSAVALTFLDGGIPYDPLSHADPDVTLSAEERPIGGLGIYMVKKTMDEVVYAYRDGKNVLTIRKYL